MKYLAAVAATVALIACSSGPKATLVRPDIEFVQLSGPADQNYSPGRIDPLNAAWTASRKPLAAEFTFRGKTYFVIVNHFNSKGGDSPLFGRLQLARAVACLDESNVGMRRQDVPYPGFASTPCVTRCP